MKVLEVAAFLLRAHGPMNAMKLHKLVYYSQAWHLVEHRSRLFDEEIQAWAYGPVVYELYKQHRGSLVVETIAGESDTVSADPAATRVLHAVWSCYGAMSSAELSRITHAEAPWQDARREPEGEAGRTPITPASMLAYYSQQPKIDGLAHSP
jgi:uncharacterized phage-associated protein